MRQAFITLATFALLLIFTQQVQGVMVQLDESAQAGGDQGTSFVPVDASNAAFGLTISARSNINDSEPFIPAAAARSVVS